MRRSVRFLYVTGVREPLFRNAVLVGSFKPHGSVMQHSELAWSRLEMTAVTHTDGCPAFTRTVELETDDPESIFEWGVEVDGPGGSKIWAIPMEENDAASTRRVRRFRLADGANAGDHTLRDEVFYLSQARRLGAQKHVLDGKTGLQFSVWAPGADSVEVYIGALWENGPNGRAPLVTESGVLSVAREQIHGGYIADAAPEVSRPEGAHSSLGPFSMRRCSDGVWCTDTGDGLGDFTRFDHAPYMYRVSFGDKSLFRTDLYSRCQIGSGSTRPNGSFSGRPRELDGGVSCSVVVDPDRVAAQFSEPSWPETQWLDSSEFFAQPAPSPALARGNGLDWVIYELHVGALGFGRRGATEPGTLEDALALLDYLEDLGVNAIELLPLSEFGGDSAAWGYSTSHYFAIEYSGGGRDQYKWFVRECHRRGIAVILDVVYNHYSHNAERAEWMFDAAQHHENRYYWYEGTPADYADYDRQVGDGARGHGGYVDNLSTGYAPRYHEELVRAMFISSAVALVTEFNVDGLRVDQTTSIRSYNVRHADGRPVPSANAFGAKLLRELTRTLKLVRPSVVLTAEDHDNWHGVTEDPDRGGLGFDAAWYADFYHHLVGDTDKGSEYAKLIKTAGYGDDRPLAMDYFAGALQATHGGKKVVYHESHDEAGNGHSTDRTIRVAVNGAPLIGETRRFAEARCRFAAGVTVLSAGIPMFLFGEEVGSERRFLYGSVLENREDLEALRASTGARLFNYYRELIRLRRNNVGLRSPNLEVLYTHNANRVIAFRRWGGGQELLIAASLNNRPFSAGYGIAAPGLIDAEWREVWSSDARELGGDGVNNAGATRVSSGGRIGLNLPANGLVVLARV